MTAPLPHRPRPGRTLPFRRLASLLLAALLGSVGVAAGQAAAIPEPGALKRMTIEQLMDIDVTSVARRPEKLFTSASAIQLLTAEDVRRSGATSLPEALRLASNLEVAQIDSRQWAITARGFNNVFADKMLVLIDGRSVYTPLYAGVYWDVQDVLLADLDRIEVISGPGSTQWGANAVNGVINITTKNARDTQGALVSAGFGSELRQAGSVRYGGVTERGVYYRVYAKYLNRGDSVRFNGRDSNDAWHMAQGGFRVDGRSAVEDQYTLQGDLYNGMIGQIGPDNIRVNGLNLLGRWTRQLQPDSDLKLQAYFDRTHRRIPGSFTQDLNTCDLDFQHHLAGDRHELVWGLGARLVVDHIANTSTNAFLPAHVSRPMFNVFVQDEITLVPNQLAVTLGTKVEHNDYTGFELEPSVRAAYTPNRQNTVWAAVSRAVRTPSRVDRDLYSPATPPYRMVGGTRVVSETLLAYEIGYRVQIDPAVILSVATFYHDYDNLRSLEPLNPPLAFPVASSSGLRGRSTGAETTAEWRVRPSWRLRAGYTEQRVHSEPQPGTNDRGTRDSIARDPNREITLRSMWDLSARWELDAQGRYVAPIGSQGVPGYTEADARIGWTPGNNWELSVSGQNLLHRRHGEFNAAGGRREIQRSVFAKASWRF